jgi:hypothetical protein
MAPNVGDGGFLGAPTLEPLAEVSLGGEQMPSFGYFYEALDGLGIRPYDLVVLREFMVAHGGHRLHLSGPDDEADEADDDTDDDLGAILHAHKAEKTRRTESGEFRVAILEVACNKCREHVASSEPELLKQFEPFTPSPEAVASFVERWGRDPDDGWNHRIMGIADPYEPFMEELVEFTKEHRRHPLQVRLQAAT